MSTLDDVRIAVSDLNGKYPRPGMPTLEVSDPYDIRSSFASPYPNFNLPGVYILLSEAGVVLRIGKASCGRHLAGRLSDYFRWEDRSVGRGAPKDGAYRDACYVATIGVPADRAFEAPAIEEFLLGRINAPLNRNGISSNNGVQPTCEDARGLAPAVMPSEPIVLPASVTVDAFEDGGQAFYSVKVGTAAFEINIHLLAEDASKFGSVLAVQWVSGALRIGECAGAPVFWCSGEDGSSISVLVGHDDQTWDFGVQLPASTISEILDGIERASNANA